MPNLLSIGFTLLVLGLTLTVQWRVMRGGKKVSLQRMGASLMVLGVGMGVVIWLGAIWRQGLPSQEMDVFLNTAIAIVLTGGILAIQGVVQKKPSNLPWVKYGALVVFLIGIASIVLDIFVW